MAQTIVFFLAPGFAVGIEAAAVQSSSKCSPLVGPEFGASLGATWSLHVCRGPSVVTSP